ncbi:hypothetical protein [Nocardia sp. NPDC024068]|uniref:hypothetical protein n=1 Tax=Nocardia sp. NPDC024068 TaxID=3157197 RepID=UPI00340363A6
MSDSDVPAARPVPPGRPGPAPPPAGFGTGGSAPAPTAGRVVDPLPGDVLAVVERWNPQGAALLSTSAAGGTAAPVSLIGPDDANTALLRTELTRIEPRVELSAPDTEPVVSPGAVVLLALDAGVVIGAGELDTVRRLHDRGARVLLVLNGTHAHRDWELARDRTAEIMAAAGPVCEIVPVSPRLALAARTSADSALFDQSGLGLLHTRLIALTADGSTAASRRRTAAAQVVADTRERIAQEEATLRSGSETEMLRSERARLLAERDGGRAVAVSNLRAQLNLARVDLLTQVGARVRTLHAEARAELDRPARSGRREFPERLRSAVNQVTAAVDLDIAARLTELRARAAAAPAPGSAGPDGTPPQRHDPAPTLGPDPQPRGRGVEDHLMIVLGASAGVGLGRLLVSPLALVPALDAATIPVTLLLGAGAAAWVVRARRQLADRDHLRQWVADAIANVKAQLEQRAVTALVETESELSDEMVRSAAAHMLDVDRRVAELEVALRRATSGQPGRLAACARDQEILERWAGGTGK